MGNFIAKDNREKSRDCQSSWNNPVVSDNRRSDNRDLTVFGNLHFPSILSIVFTSFKHPKLPVSIKIPVTPLQIVYICMTAISSNSSS